MFHTLQPPVVDADGRLEPLLRKNAWLDGETPAPPAGWMEPDFDDSGWLRTMAQGGCQTPYLARQCLRGKFLVEDPAQVSDLRLSVGYHGGVVVYLNGQELARRHLPAQSLGEATLADGYPLEAFVQPGGDLLAQEGTYIGPGRLAGKPDAESARRIGGPRPASAGFRHPAVRLASGSQRAGHRVDPRALPQGALGDQGCKRAARTGTTSSTGTPASCATCS